MEVGSLQGQGWPEVSSPGRGAMKTPGHKSTSGVYAFKSTDLDLFQNIPSMVDMCEKK